MNHGRLKIGSEQGSYLIIIVLWLVVQGGASRGGEAGREVYMGYLTHSHDPTDPTDPTPTQTAIQSFHATQYLNQS